MAPRQVVELAPPDTTTPLVLPAPAIMVVVKISFMVALTIPKPQTSLIPMSQAGVVPSIWLHLRLEFPREPPVRVLAMARPLAMARHLDMAPAQLVLALDPVMDQARQVQAQVLGPSMAPLGQVLVMVHMARVPVQELVTAHMAPVQVLADLDPLTRVPVLVLVTTRAHILALVHRLINMARVRVPLVCQAQTTPRLHLAPAHTSQAY